MGPVIEDIEAMLCPYRLLFWSNDVVVASSFTLVLKFHAGVASML